MCTMRFLIILLSVFSIASGWQFLNPFSYFGSASNDTEVRSLNITNVTDYEVAEKQLNFSDYADIDLMSLCNLADSNSTNTSDSSSINLRATNFNHLDSNSSVNLSPSIANSTKLSFNITEVCAFFSILNANLTDFDTAITDDNVESSTPISTPECTTAFNCNHLLPFTGWANLTSIKWPSSHQDALDYCDMWAQYAHCLEKYLSSQKSDCIRRDVAIEDDQLSMSLVQKYHDFVCFNASSMASFLDRAACYLHPSVLEAIFTARYQWKAMASWDQVCASLWFVESIQASMVSSCEASVAESFQALIDVLAITANKAIGLPRTYKTCRAGLARPSQLYLDFITNIADHRILFKFGEASMKLMHYGKRLIHSSSVSLGRAGGDPGSNNQTEQQKQKERSSMYATMLMMQMSNKMP